MRQSQTPLIMQTEGQRGGCDPFVVVVVVALMPLLAAIAVRAPLPGLNQGIPFTRGGNLSE